MGDRAAKREAERREVQSAAQAVEEREWARQERTQAAQVFIDGPPEEYGCTACCEFYRGKFGWIWGHAHRNWPWRGMTVDDDGTLRCTHRCHDGEYVEHPVALASL
jgi:hypothetical protein